MKADTPPRASIARSLWKDCFLADHEIGGLDEAEATAWAGVNALRHADTCRILLTHRVAAEGAPLRILNSSGLAVGGQDFAIVSWLHANGIAVDWTVVESPRSKYLANPLLRERLAALGIGLVLHDYASGRAPDVLTGAYDFVLFTEILEHLDHSAALRALEDIRARLCGDGTLVLSSPNLLSLLNRLRFVAGFGDAPFFHDGPEDLRAGVFGHVALWDVKRLRRLLGECGYEVTSCETKNYGVGPGRFFPLRRLAFEALAAASALVPHAGQLIVATARPRSASTGLKAGRAATNITEDAS